VKKQLLAAAFAVAFASDAIAHEYKLGDLTIVHPFARATPAGAKVGGAYFTIENRGTAPERLVSVTSEASPVSELHEMAMANGVMTMRPRADGIAIPAGSKVELKPGGLHVMLIGLVTPLVKGEKVKARLVFEKAGPVDVVFNVEAIGAGSAGSHDSGAHAH
jgi:periplasmic copper chaperone A